MLAPLSIPSNSLLSFPAHCSPSSQFPASLLLNTSRFQSFLVQIHLEAPVTSASQAKGTWVQRVLPSELHPHLRSLLSITFICCTTLNVRLTSLAIKMFLNSFQHNKGTLVPCELQIWQCYTECLHPPNFYSSAILANSKEPEVFETHVMLNSIYSLAAGGRVVFNDSRMC